MTSAQSAIWYLVDEEFLNIPEASETAAPILSEAYRLVGMIGPKH